MQSSNAIPYKRKGDNSEYDVYLCRQNVLIQGEFLNQLAGFDASGERVRDPYACVLEVRSEDGPNGVLLASMTLDGAALESRVEASAWFATSLGKNQWEELLPEEPEDGEWEEAGRYGGYNAGRRDYRWLFQRGTGKSYWRKGTGTCFQCP